MQGARIITEFLTTPWAVLPQTLAAMTMVLSRWASGARLSDAEIQAAVGDAPEAAARRREEAAAVSGRGVMVLPLYGIIAHRAHLVNGVSSPRGTSTEMFRAALRGALADETVGTILIDVDSPGGSVYDVAELAADIAAAREKKRIVAIANSLAASAAYWLASAASEFVITPGGEAGSIGVFTAHEDWSKHLEQQGVKPTLISAGKYKVEGNPYGPLSEDAHAAIQARVNEYYDAFVKDVARLRGVSVTAVRNGFGEGRVLGAKAALAEGMVDRIATFDETVARLMRTKPEASTRAQVQTPALRPAHAAAERELRILGA